jgi:hypothetical protein
MRQWKPINDDNTIGSTRRIGFVATTTTATTQRGNTAKEKQPRATGVDSQQQKSYVKSEPLHSKMKLSVETMF